MIKIGICDDNAKIVSKIKRYVELAMIKKKLIFVFLKMGKSF